MVVSTLANNITAQYAANSIRHSLDNVRKDTIEAATGKKFTSAAEGAIGEGLKTDQSTFRSAGNNAAQAQSVLNIATGAAELIDELAAQLKGRAASANSGALGANELGFIKKEMDALIAQIDTIVGISEFNGEKVVDGTYTSKNFQVGLTSTDIITVDIAALDSTTLGINAIDVTTDAVGANNALDAAITTIKSVRAQLGADTTRFEFASSSIEDTINNLASAQSIYLDADLADVSIRTQVDKNQTIAAISTLAEANNLQGNLLKLLG